MIGKKEGPDDRKPEDGFCKSLLLYEKKGVVFTALSGNGVEFLSLHQRE